MFSSTALAALRNDALNAGDFAMVTICDRAADHDEDAIAEVERMLAEADAHAAYERAQATGVPAFAIITDITPNRATIAALIDNESPTDEQLGEIGENRLSYRASWLIIAAPASAKVGERIWR